MRRRLDESGMGVEATLIGVVLTPIALALLGVRRGGGRSERGYAGRGRKVLAAIVADRLRRVIVRARGLAEWRGVRSRRLLRCAHVLQVRARCCADSV